MPQRIILLSGPIASGKSTLGTLLHKEHKAVLFKTNQLINALMPSVPNERKALQEAGEALDKRTRGEWVGQALARKVQDLDEHSIVVVDAVRMERQIESIRKAFGPKAVHVHLTASSTELQQRYSRRKGKIKELSAYQDVRESQTEDQIEVLKEVADIVINTNRCTDKDVLVRVAAQLDLFSRDTTTLVDVLVGGQYGSEGKGNIVSYLAREYDFLVRVGGPNAGHKVYREEGPYTFHLLPSGTRTSEAKLVIGPGANLAPDILLKEIRECSVTSDRLFIDPRAMIIEEKDRRFEEKNLKDTIGSTGQGVGAATARRIIERGKEIRMAEHIRELRPFIKRTEEVLDAAYAQGKRILLEGTQGASLSLYHGDYPWVTSRDTNVSGALAEAGIAPRRVRKIVMVCRTYPIRVGGTSGPMSQEIDAKEIARRSGLSHAEILRVERTSTTNKPRRIAEFDWVQLHRSTMLNGPTDIALTFVDYLDKDNRKARRFEQLSQDTIQFIEEVEQISGAPVSLISTRFHSRSVIDRRAW